MHGRHAKWYYKTVLLLKALAEITDKSDLQNLKKGIFTIM
jgi:hypothetical protein